MHGLRQQQRSLQNDEINKFSCVPRRPKSASVTPPLSLFLPLFLIHFRLTEPLVCDSLSRKPRKKFVWERLRQQQKQQQTHEGGCLKKEISFARASACMYNRIFHKISYEYTYTHASSNVLSFYIWLYRHFASSMFYRCFRHVFSISLARTLRRVARAPSLRFLYNHFLHTYINILCTHQIYASCLFYFFCCSFLFCFLSLVIVTWLLFFFRLFFLSASEYVSVRYGVLINQGNEQFQGCLSLCDMISDT